VVAAETLATVVDDLLPLIGVIVGALISGGAAWWIERRRGLVAGLAGARLLETDLRDALAGIDRVVAEKRWAERADEPPDDLPTTLWLEQRSLLAASENDMTWSGISRAFQAVIKTRRLAERSLARGELAVTATKLALLGAWREEVRAGVEALERQTGTRDEPVSFLQLAEAEHEATWNPDPEVRHEWRKTRDARRSAFARHTGKIESDYWGKTGGVVVVAQHVHPALGVIPRRPVYSLHSVRLSEFGAEGAAGSPDLAALLHESEVLAIKAATLVRGRAQQLIVSTIGRIHADVLRALDESREAAVAVRRSAAEDLKGLERTYASALTRQAQQVYLGGMLVVLGVVAVAALPVAAALDALGVSPTTLENLFGAILGGGAGSFVSVLGRFTGLSSSAELDPELGPAWIRRLGAGRVVIGVVSAIVAFFVLTAVLAATVGINRGTSIYWFVVVGFLAGFAERWTRITLSGVPSPSTASQDAAGEVRRNA
jgi:hypothetical protein